MTIVMAKQVDTRINSSSHSDGNKECGRVQSGNIGDYGDMELCRKRRNICKAFSLIKSTGK